MNITHRPAADNFHVGRRSGVEVDLVVIHVTEGDRQSVRSWFDLDQSEVSAHYMVCTDGSIDQFVNEQNTAFHAGRVLNATAPLVLERPGVNPNLYSIGIEHEGDGKHELAPKQRAASYELILDIRKRHPKVQLSRRHIVGHHEVYAGKTCPGAINVDRIVQDLQTIAGINTPPARPLIVWSEYAKDWLVVTRVVSDKNWEFVPLSAVRRGTVTKATSPLSTMPLVKP